MKDDHQIGNGRPGGPCPDIQVSRIVEAVVQYGCAVFPQYGSSQFFTELVAKQRTDIQCIRGHFEFIAVRMVIPVIEFNPAQGEVGPIQPELFLLLQVGKTIS